MSNCIRNGVRYKRHKMNGRCCMKCGGVSLPAEKVQEILHGAVEQMVTKLRKQEVNDFQAAMSTGNTING